MLERRHLLGACTITPQLAASAGQVVGSLAFSRRYGYSGQAAAITGRCSARSSMSCTRNSRQVR